MLKWKLMFLLFFIVGNVYCMYDSNRMIDSFVVDPDHYDYSIVEIKYLDDNGRPNICTGTLISDKHILTAYNCVRHHINAFPQKRRFTMNIVDVAKYSESLGIFYDKDIAVISLPNDAVLSKTAYPIHLSADLLDEESYQKQINSTAYMAGYSVFDFQRDQKVEAGMHSGLLDLNPRDKLRVRKVPLFPKGTCHRHQDLLCTSDYTPYAYPEDTGGPLLFHNMQTNYRIHIKTYQFGILIKNGSDARLHTAVPLYPYCGWIAQVTNGAANCHIIFPKDSKRSLPLSSEAAFNDTDDATRIPYLNKLNPPQPLPIDDSNDDEKNVELLNAAEDENVAEEDCILNCILLAVLIFAVILLLCYCCCFKTENKNALPPFTKTAENV